MQNQNNVNHDANQQEPENAQTQIGWPGIHPQMIAAAGIRRTEYPECHEAFGSFIEGILIPYHDAEGNVVSDDNGAYFRIQFDRISEGKDYFQKSVKLHSYLPPNFRGFVGNEELILVGSELSALALASEGLAAVGCPGLSLRDGSPGYDGYANKEGLTDEFVSVLELMQPKRIVFIGERDALFDLRFFKAAVELANWLPLTSAGGAKIFAQCIPPDNSAETIAGCREEIGADFGNWFRSVIDSEVEILPSWETGAAVVALLRNQNEALKRLCAAECDQHVLGKKLAKLAVDIADPLAEEQVRKLASTLGIKPRPFNAEVKRLRLRGNRRETEYPNLTTIIDLSSQNGEWTGAVVRAISDETFVVGGGELARLHKGCLQPFTPAALAAFADTPGRCRFVKTNAAGENAMVPFTQNHSQLILGSTIQHAQYTRPVDFVSAIPVLVLNSDGKSELITGYSEGNRILVPDGAECELDLSTLRPTCPLHELIELLRDFDFLTDGSFARTIAMLLTPALARGGFLKSGRVPLHVISKNELGAGGGFMCRILFAIYGHPPTPLAPRNPDKLHESLSNVVFEGKSIAYLDNIRGDILSQVSWLESFLTEPVFDARKIFRHGLINVEHFMLLATSNGMTVSRDIADRFVEISIQKRSPDYTFKQWPEGNIFRHIEANRGRYLAAIYGAIQNWVEAGMPSGTTTGLRYSEWESAVSWMVEQILPNKGLRLFPQGRAGRVTAAERLSTLDFDLVTKICRELDAAGYAGRELTAADIAGVCGDSTDFGGDDPVQAARNLGMKLARFFRDGKQLKVVGDGFQIRRSKKSVNGRLQHLATL